MAPLRRPPSTGRPPIPKQPDSKQKSNRTPAAKVKVEAPTDAATLYLEQWTETGSGGTQTQIPKRVAEDFFGHRPGFVTWLTLHTPTGSTEVRLSGFDNVTYRITLGFTRTTARPAVLRFERVDTDEYAVEARSEGERGYVTWRRRCTEGRAGVKQYGFA